VDIPGTAGFQANQDIQVNPGTADSLGRVAILDSQDQVGIPDTLDRADGLDIVGTPVRVFLGTRGSQDIPGIVDSPVHQDILGSVVHLATQGTLGNLDGADTVVTLGSLGGVVTRDTQGSLVIPGTVDSPVLRVIPDSQVLLAIQDSVGLLGTLDIPGREFPGILDRE